MGTGYVRNDSGNNIADGNVINASDLDGEFDAIAAALATSGHTHDGTAAEGGAVTVLGPAQDFVATASVIRPKTNNTLDIGTDSLEFKDLYLEGKAYIDGFGEDTLFDTNKKIQFRDAGLYINSSGDGILDLVSDTELQVTAPTVDINASTAVLISNDLKLDSDAAVLGFGVDNDVTLTHVADTGLLLNSTMALQFNDASQSINAPTNEILDINATAEIELNATLIDLNGNLDVSGTALITGVATFTDTPIFNSDVSIQDDLLLDSDGAVLSFGEDNEVTLTHVADTGLLLNSTMALQFNDASQFINAPSATVLDINATSEIELNATLIDLNGNLDVSGTALITGIATFTDTPVFNSDVTIEDDLYLDSDAAVIHFGEDADVTLTHVADTGLLLNGTSQLQFNDASQFINAPTNEILDINATAEIELNATLVDVNANLDVSGTLGVAGVSTFGGGTSISTAGVLSLEAGGSLTTAAGNDLNIVYPDGRSLIFKEAGTTTLTLDNAQGATFAGAALVTGVLTTTAATVFNGGFAANNAITVTTDGSTKSASFVGNGIEVKATGSNQSNLFIGTQSGNDVKLAVIGAHPLRFYTNSAERLQIAADGSVFTPTSGTSNVRFGVNAGNSIASGGNYNTVVGDEAGTAISTGDQNTAVGFNALASENTNNDNTAIGFQSLQSQDGGDGNTAVGSNSLPSLTNASRVTAVGNYAGFSSLGADDCTFIGHDAGRFATTAVYSTFVGSQAGQGITGTKLTGNYNTAIGYNAGLLLQGTATENTLVGALAGDSITTGDENVCMGMGAGSTISTGTRNTCLGDDAGSGITTATRSIAIGHIAMGSAVDSKTGTGNVAIGYQTGNALAAGAENVMIGEFAGTALTSGSRNTCVGMNSGRAVSTAVDNVFLGNQAGNYTVGTTTGSYNTIVGGYCHTSAVDSIQQIVMGHNVTGNGNNTLCFGNAGTDSSIAFGATSITAPSDQRYKEEIADATAGLSFIKDLRPVTFKWKKEKDVPSDHPAYKEGSDKRVMESNGEINHGFIAQEVKAVIDNHSEIKDGFAMWSEQGLDENGNSTGGRQRLGDGALIPILVKAIQELEARLAVLEG